MNAPDADRAALGRFIEGGRVPMPVESNPMAQALGMVLRAVDPACGGVELGFEPGGQFVQGTGVLQGGALAGMLDFAMAFAVMSKLADGETCATVSLNLSLMRPAPQGLYIARGELERRGRAMAFARATLETTGPEPVCVATATSVLALRA